MRAGKILEYALVGVLLFLTDAAYCSQIDTVALWNGEKDHHKTSVQMFVFRPEKPNGTGVVVCPGGSYYWLDESGEGLDVGEWLSSNGFTAFVLFYRTAGAPEFVWHSRIVARGVRHPDMITDAQLALKWAWDHSKDYGIKKGKTGIMGFSAGGHLALSSLCFHKTNFIYGRDALDGENYLKPAFVAAIYPVVTMKGRYAHKRSRRGLIGDIRQGNKALRDSLSIEEHIPADCPPVFFINCKDDPVVDYRNSELLDSALNAAGVNHKYIQYDTGKHGFGVSDHYGSPECRQWRNEFLEWAGTLYSERSL